MIYIKPFYNCPECGKKLILKHTTNINDGTRSYLQNCYLCENCLSTWVSYDDENGETKLERYFFG